MSDSEDIMAGNAEKNFAIGGAESESEDYDDYGDEQEEEAQEKSMMIDLWKKLQDLLRIQTQEEVQDSKEKIKKQRTQKLKYYKVTLSKDELDKFSHKKEFNDLTVDLLFST